MASSLFRSIAMHCVIALSTALCVGQAPTEPAATVDVKSFAYDVVSVKPDHSNGPNSGSWRSTKNGFSANVPVRSLIMSAYDVLMENQISGLPGWGNTDQFDVEAKMDADTMAAFEKLSKNDQGKQYSAMFQKLLADRFNLKVREETKELPVYALTIAKGGPKLKVSAKDSGYSMGAGSLKGTNIPMELLALNLSGQVGRLIVDKTGLTGKYDVDLKWTMDDDPGAGNSGPSLFTALQEELGLKLDSIKAPVKIIVIEHIEKPSEN